MEEKPLLKIGIVSDSQGYGYDEDWGFDNLGKAFDILAAKRIDVLVNAGDICDYGDDDVAVRHYAKLFRDKFSTKVPEHVACLGNHDYWTHGGGRTPEDCRRDFFAALGEGPSPVKHKVVGGYDFIAVSSDSGHADESADEALLRPALERAARRDAVKPIFVVTHFHPAGTIAASRNRSDGRPSLRKILNDFPQVVSLSGHTHTPLWDERNIWQGEFTALNTSGLSYACVQAPYVGLDDDATPFANCWGPIPPVAREGIFFMYAEVFADRTVFHRYSAEDGIEIKPDAPWTVAVPYSREGATYTDARAALRNAPEFQEGSRPLFRYDAGFCYVVIDPAKHDDFVHAYRVAMTELDGAGGEVKTMCAKFIGDFYRGARHRGGRMCLRLPPNTLEAGRRYRFDVFPVETFGKEGRPITMTIAISPSYAFTNLKEIGPLE